MKFRLMAMPVLAIATGLLSQCTQKYTDGKTTMDDRTLRPGEDPIGASEKVGPSDSPSPAARASAGLATWRIDPDAPKQSNGGSGSEVAPPTGQPAR